MEFYIHKYHFFAPNLHTLQDWKQWQKGERDIGADDEELPNVDFVPSMQRRKLSQSIKMTISVAHNIADEYKDIACVYSSMFGEWEKTVKQLEKHHEEKEVSPAAFGLSVHNAAIGMFSLIQGNNKFYTSVSGNGHSFDAGLIEAIATLTKEDKVLYVAADERVPDIYKLAFPEKNMPLAIGLIISRDKLSSDDIKICADFNENEKNYSNNYQHSLDFIRFVLGSEKCFEGENYKMTKLNE